jgi:diguanylate cyclase (GGDEF)-like protein
MDPSFLGRRWSLPFLGALGLGWVTMPATTSVAAGQYGISVALLLLAGLITLGPAAGAGRRSLVVGNLLLLAAIGVLRSAAGGFTSSAAVLATIPVFSVALASRHRRDVEVMLVALAAFYVVPVLVVGGAAYPPSQLRAALLVLCVNGIVGIVGQRLVDRTRSQAEEALSRGRMLEEVSETVHRLADSPDVRRDVCRAIGRISAAAVVTLYEPSNGELVCTAAVGFAPGESRIVAVPGSTAHDTFARGRPVLLESDAGRRVGNRDLWEATGRPAAVLYQPLCRRGTVLGVLVVGWPGQVRADAPRCTVAALLAHEAAALIARSDALEQLADVANTDPLTGLPNRRAWDAALAGALASTAPLTVAMLDLDHFKQFNDSFGHPAGDRLLRATSAAWRRELRGGDLLARLGGEEFGLLLEGCSATTATEIVERLRSRVPSDQTCSAGIATRAGDEDAGELVARADAALYAAKATGRDRSRVYEADRADSATGAPRPTRNVVSHTSPPSSAVAPPTTHTPPQPSDAYSEEVSADRAAPPRK